MPQPNARDSYLKRTYGITLAQYNALLESQGFSCAVCGKHKDKEKRSLSVDHDHVSMEIRGLLCNFCNGHLIGRHRNANLFESAAVYLRQGTGLFVPKKKRKRRRRKK